MDLNSTFYYLSLSFISNKRHLFLMKRNETWPIIQLKSTQTSLFSCCLTFYLRFKVLFGYKPKRKPFFLFLGSWFGRKIYYSNFNWRQFSSLKMALILKKKQKRKQLFFLCRVESVIKVYENQTCWDHFSLQSLPLTYQL